LDSIYKIEPISHSCGKGSQQSVEGPWREPGESKKTSQAKYEYKTSH